MQPKDGVSPGHEFLCPETNTTYVIDDHIASGGAAVVHRCHEKGKEKTQYAVKIVDLSDLRVKGDLEPRLRSIGAEVAVLRRINHPGIVRLLAAVETKHRLYIVMHLLSGGELFYRIVDSGALKEEHARYIFVQLIHAVNYLHAQGIMHRDLKPENVLIKGEAAPGFPIVQIADFGLAKFLDGRAMTFVGTPQYWAPEVLTASSLGKPYGPAADLWSLGIVLFVMLAGTYPFSNRDGNLHQRIMGGHFHFNHPRLASVSEGAKKLIRRLLAVDPEKRMTMAQCLADEWVNEPFSSTTPPLPSLTAPAAETVRPPPVHLGSVLKKALKSFAESQQDPESPPVAASSKPEHAQAAGSPAHDDVWSIIATGKVEKEFGAEGGIGAAKLAARAVFNLQDFLHLEFAIYQRVSMALLAFRHHPKASKLLGEFVHQFQCFHYMAVDISRKFEKTCSTIVCALPDLSTAIKESQEELAIHILEDFKQYVVHMKADGDEIRIALSSFTRKIKGILELALNAKRHVDHNVTTFSSAQLGQPDGDQRMPRHHVVVVEDLDVAGDIGNCVHGSVESPPNAEHSSRHSKVHQEAYDKFREHILSQIRRVVDEVWEHVQDPITPALGYNPDGLNPDSTDAGPLTPAGLARQLLDFLLLSPRCRIFAKELLHHNPSCEEDVLLGMWPRHGVQGHRGCSTQPVNTADGSDSPSCSAHTTMPMQVDTASLDSVSSSDTGEFLRQNVEAATLLQRALIDLRQVDDILLRCAAFWGNIASTLEQLANMKKHALKLLQFSCKFASFRARFLLRLEDYHQFWSTLQAICSKYNTAAERRWDVYQQFARRIEATAEVLDTTLSSRRGVMDLNHADAADQRDRKSSITAVLGSPYEKERAT